MENPAALRTNLARLRARHPRVASRVESATSEGIERVDCRSGGHTLACDGVLLASRHDPAAEGERIAREMADRRVDVWIAIGFSLGHQVEAARRLAPVPLIMYEPAPERLRAALALRPDLDWIDAPDVCFAESAQELADEVVRRYVPGLRVHVTVHPSALRLAPDEVREAVEVVGGVKDSIDIAARTRLGLEAWTKQTVENAPYYLDLPSTSSLRGRFRGRPAVVAAAGPSLDKQLPLLAERADRMLVFAVGPSLGALRERGIEPDLVHVLEASDVAHQFERSGKTESLDLIVTPKVHQKLFELPVRNRFIAYSASERFAWWAAEQMGETHPMSAAASVALNAVLLAAELGANPILLIGQDLAFTDGRVYAKGSCYERIGFENHSQTEFRYTQMEERLEAYDGDRKRMEYIAHQRTVWVEGWNGERLPTSPAYAWFREGYRSIGRELHARGIRLINCTEGGARIPEIDHRTFAGAVEEFATEAFDARDVIQKAADSVLPVDRSCFEAPLARARRGLRRIERDARRGSRDAESTLRRWRCMRNPSAIVGDLRRVARWERVVKKHLGLTPWLDSLVQHEVQQAEVLFLRADRADPTPEEALEESVALFEGTVKGCERATSLLDRFQELVLDGGS